MKKSLQGIGAVLLIAAVFTVFGGFTSLKDVSGAKDYWEKKDIETDEDLAKLEDGLNELKENEKAYLDGRKEIKSGKEEYADGVRKLADGYGEYADGEARLKEGQKAYDDGVKSAAQAKAVYDAIEGLKKNGVTFKQAIAMVAAATDNDEATIRYACGMGGPEAQAEQKKNLALAKQVYDNVERLQKGLTHEEAVRAVAAANGVEVALIKKAYESGKNYDALKANLEQAKTLYETVNLVQKTYGKDGAVAVVSELKGAAAGEITDLYDNNAVINQVHAAVESLKSGMEKSQAIAVAAAQLNTTVENVTNLYDNNADIVALHDAVQKLMDEQSFDLATAAQKVDEAKGLPAGTALNAYNNYARSNAVKAAVDDLIANGTTHENAVRIIAVNQGVDVAAVNAMYDNFENSNAVVQAVNFLMMSGKTVDQAKGFIAGMKGLDMDTINRGYESGKNYGALKARLDSAKQVYDGVENLKNNGVTKAQAITMVAVSSGKDEATIKNAYKNGDPKSQAANKAKLRNAKAVYDNVNRLQKGMKHEEAVKAVAATTGKTVSLIEFAYANGGGSGRAAALRKLAEGRQQLIDGKAQLSDAARQLAAGERKLADARRQIKDGEAQLAEFEDGRDRAIDGIEEVKTSAPDGDLKSIEDRLGSDYDYMKNKTDLNIEKGLESVAAARDYKADSGEAIAEELKSRTIGSVASMVAAVFAIAAAVFGFLKKNRGAAAAALTATVAAVVGTGFILKAGTTFSAIAGHNNEFAAKYPVAVLAVLAAVLCAVGFRAGKAGTASGKK